MKIIENNINAPLGFQSSGIHCGIKKEKKDLAIIYSEVPAIAAGVFTQNIVKAAPIYICQENLKKPIRGILCNSGNANACTGKKGYEDGLTMLEETAKHLSIKSSELLLASTGVIGVPLPIDTIIDGIPKLIDKIGANSIDCKEAIMTTDTFSKDIAVEIQLSNSNVKIGGIAKGSGMIHPNMATLLGFITTDIKISQELLQLALSEIIEKTFNMISVDGDTSTNDTVLVLANGMAENETIASIESPDYQLFYQGLYFVCETLAKLIAKDGEGATKLITSKVIHAPSEGTAKKIAKSIITSSLTKAAIFGEDANWGRILCAAGYSGAQFDVDSLSISIVSNKGTLHVFDKGSPIEFDEDYAKEILAELEVTILLNLSDGSFNATAWGCDLTYDYVKINGSYRS